MFESLNNLSTESAAVLCTALVCATILLYRFMDFVRVVWRR